MRSRISALLANLVMGALEQTSLMVYQTKKNSAFFNFKISDTSNAQTAKFFISLTPQLPCKSRLNIGDANE